MLAEKGISKMEFAKSVEISNATLAKMGKDEAVSLTTIDKIQCITISYVFYAKIHTLNILHFSLHNLL